MGLESKERPRTGFSVGRRREESFLPSLPLPPLSFLGSHPIFRAGKTPKIPSAESAANIVLRGLRHLYHTFVSYPVSCKIFTVKKKHQSQTRWSK